MANSKKFAVKNGLQTQNIDFVSNSELYTIQAKMLESDTLSFSGNTGQLFSITDSQTGSIFAVNDVSGMPSIEVFDTGKIQLAELTGNVGIGNTAPAHKLSIGGNVSISGTGFATGDFRAPGFYDSNNTAYYTDPAGSSVLNATYIGGHLYDSYNGSNPRIRAGSAGAAGLLIADSGNNFKVQLYGDGTYYGFLGSTWGSWDLQKTVGGSLFLNANTSYYVNPAATSNLNTLNLNTLTVSGYAYNTPYEHTWYGTSTYSWDGSTMSYYYILIGTAGNNCMTTVDYLATGDSNYPQTVRGTVQISAYSGSSVSIEHSTYTGDPFGVQVYLDNTNKVWMRIPGCAWASTFKWRFVNLYDFAVTTDSTKQLTLPTNSYLINTGESLKFTRSAANSGPTATYVRQQVNGRYIGLTDLRAPLFYDNNNTSYYVDPASNSNISVLTVANIYGNTSITSAAAIGTLTFGSATQTSYYSTKWTTDTGYSEIWRGGSAYGSSYTGVAGFNIYNSNTTAGHIGIFPGSSSTAAVFAAANGNVGIATNTPAAKLHVAGGSSLPVRLVSSTFAGIEYHNTDGTWATYIGTESGAGGIRYNTLNGNHNWYANSVQRAQLSNTGLYIYTSNTKVVIGNTAPTVYYTGWDTQNVSALEVYANGSGTSVASLNLVNNTLSYNAAYTSVVFSSAALTASVDKRLAMISCNLADTANTSSANAYMSFSTRSSVDSLPVERVRFVANGNVGIGNTTPIDKLRVEGSFSAITKSFLIDHPTKEGKKLRYASLEGPENGVYVRGTSNSNIIVLPEYWTELIHEDSITVNLTARGGPQTLYVEDIKDNKVFVAAANNIVSLQYFYTVYAERKDVDKLVVEE